MRAGGPVGSGSLNVKGFAMNMIYAAWSGGGIVVIAFIELFWKQREQWNGGGIELSAP